MKAISIQIPNDKAATYNVVTFIIAIINLLALGFAVLNVQPGISRLIIWVGLISAVFSLMVLGLKKYNSRLTQVRTEPFFIICAISWLFSGNYLPGLFLMALALLGFITLNKKSVHFSEEGIKYPSFPARLIPWKDVDFVILKDDILTIDLKNNTLLQFTLEKNISSAINPEEFNNFCRGQLASKF